MKKVFYLFTVVLLMAACKGNEPQNKRFDPNAMIVIRGQQTQGVSPSQKAMIDGLTDLEIVQKAVNIKWMSNWAGNYYYDASETARTFGDKDKDFNKPALLMQGIDIIAYDEGKNFIIKDFLYGYDVFITDILNDTIAYVPNEVLEKARKPIEEAFERGDYDAIYRMFNEAFTFLPIKKKN